MDIFIFPFLIILFCYSCNPKPVDEHISKPGQEAGKDSLINVDSAYKYVEVFKGELICADCPGIITEIAFINDNLTYHETDTYVERKFTNSLTGSYTTDRGYKNDDDATVYVLDDDRPGNERRFLKLNDSTLIMLNDKEDIIDTTSFYKLYRVKQKN